MVEGALDDGIQRDGCATVVTKQATAPERIASEASSADARVAMTSRACLRNLPLNWAASSAPSALSKRSRARYELLHDL